MLDKRCLSLLEVINSACENSNYKVFTVEELISLMPSYFNIDQYGVLECVKTLWEREYISVKYQDDFEICMCPLTKGRLVFENQLSEEIEKMRAEKRYFLYSFLGAILGGAIITALALLVALVFRRI